MTDLHGLDVAEREIRRDAEAIFAAGDWVRGTVFERIASVVDHSRRVTLPGATRHYMAEKAGIAAREALAAQFLALGQYSVENDIHPDDDTAHDTFRRLHELVDVVVVELQGIGWQVARTGFEFLGPDLLDVEKAVRELRRSVTARYLAQ